MSPSGENPGGPARLSDDQLRSALRAEAATHRPDREAMLARITSVAMNDPAPARRGGPRLRPVVVGALVALFGGGGFAVQWALAGDSDRRDAVPPVVVTTPETPPTTAPAVTPSAGTPHPSTSGNAPRSATSPPATAPATGSPAPSAGRPDGTRPEQGPLRSDGSVDPDSGDTRGASVITLKTTERLTALKVTVRVAKTPGLSSRGGTKSVPGASVSVDVTDQPEALLYTFTLSPSDEVAPGTYTFTAKYFHASGDRDAGGDTYAAVATTASGRQLDVYGDFFPSN